jgi:hypothetical protein
MDQPHEAARASDRSGSGVASASAGTDSSALCLVKTRAVVAARRRACAAARSCATRWTQVRRKQRPSYHPGVGVLTGAGRASGRLLRGRGDVGREEHGRLALGLGGGGHEIHAGVELTLAASTRVYSGSSPSACPRADFEAEIVPAPGDRRRRAGAGRTARRRSGP